MRKPNFFKRKSKAEIILHLCVSFLFFLIAMSYLYLLVWMVLSGLKTHTEIVMNPFGLPTTWNWRNFLDVFSLLEVNGNSFLKMLFNSCYFSLLGPLLTELCCIAFAYCCTKYKFPGSSWPYMIILIMMTLPIYGSSGASYKIISGLGLVDTYAHLVIGLAGMSVNFLYYRAFYLNVSNVYMEAAMMDGAGDFATYFKIMLPMAKPIFGALYLTGWLANWNTYESALIYLPNLPTLAVGIYQFNTEMIYRARLDILFAGCVIVALPALILFTVFNKTLTSSVSFGGVKG